MKYYILPLFYIFALVNISGQNRPVFEQISSRKSNIKFNNKIVETSKENIFIYDNFYAGAGVGLGDINNDGLLDIYFCGNLVNDKLYLNKGNFVFEDITKNSGIALIDQGWSSSVSMIDINQDGLLDIFVTKELYDDNPEWRRNKLYINQGNNKFIEVAQKVGLGDTLRTRGAAFLDYDKDNDLDVFLLHQPPNPGTYSKYEEMGKNGSLLVDEYAPRLYENREGIFYDVSVQAKILDPGFANAVSVADLNKDGYPDMIVANDFEAPDKYYMNNGDGTFKNIANSSFEHTSYYSMGIDVADINNDLLLDAFIVDMVAADNFRLKSNMSGMNPDKFWKIVSKGWHYQYMYNVLQLNNGNNTFSDVAKLAGISSTDWSWSPLIADFDNDGLKDIFVSNGLLRDIRNTDADKNIKLFTNQKIQSYLTTHENIENVDIWDIVNHKELAELYPSNKLQNKLFKNNGDYQFDDVSVNWGLDEKSFSNGSAYGDLDNDGDLDLIVNNINDEAFVFKNNSTNNYLRILLKDIKNQPVLGTKVTITYGENQKQFIETSSARGMYSTSEPMVHFGLKDIKKVNTVLIEWPNGTQTNLENVASNQLIESYMNDGVAKQNKKMMGISPMLKDISADSLISFRHKENEFDDYVLQVLLPHKLSQFGPALAVGDVNNDGLEDVYIGGAYGFSSVLYVQSKNGGFLKSSEKLWDKENQYEDVDALFVDINGDGFQDLYVVSGGNEFRMDDPHYIDRIYMNDGNGNFRKGAIPNASTVSGSIVTAADYDNDGDIDLFVGGRHLPQYYPSPTSSMLLKNENGLLVNVTDIIAPELKNIGMITDATWADYDNDGDKDLIVVGEWMPIVIFNNQDGKLLKVTNNELNNATGWWFSIEQGDFDNDGDIDFIAGNLGLNYKYKTSPENPFDIYYNDFDKNGNLDIVLGYYEQDKHFPLRGFSCSSQQVPKLKEEFKKYDVFATLEIDEVYGEENLQNSLHYAVNTFGSTYIENKGDGSFELTELPVQAQFSNINDILVKDFNKDGNLDVLTVGNLFVSEIETPRNDAGIGLIMLGDGKGNFSSLDHFDSGFFARGDAKKVKTLNYGAQKLVLVAKNDGWLQIFKMDE